MPTKYNLDELRELILDPKVSMKEIQVKYNISRQRLYQLITKHNLPTKYRTKRNQFKEKYNNPLIYNLYKSLIERKSYFNKKYPNILQDAIVDELLINNQLPEYCPVFGIKLTYEGKHMWQDSTATIDKVDNSKGYCKGNICLISWKANKIKNEGSLDEHLKIIAYMEKYK